MSIASGVLILLGTLCCFRSACSVICLDFDIGIGRNDTPRIFQAEDNESCEIMLIYGYSKDLNCRTARLIGGIENETRILEFRKASPSRKLEWVSYVCKKDFCNGNPYSVSSEGGQVMNRLTDFCYLYITLGFFGLDWADLIVDAQTAYKNASSTEIENELEEHPHSYDSHGHRHFKGIKCVLAYLHEGDVADSHFRFRKSIDSTYCKIDLMFDDYKCNFSRLHLKPWTPRSGDVLWDTGIFETAKQDGQYTISQVCRTDYCTVDLNLFRSVIVKTSHSKFSWCINNAINETIRKYEAKIKEAYAAHLALPPKEREIIENMEDSEAEMDTDKLDIERSIPLIERFRKVDPELLRLSDYQIEMGKKSEMWIQRAIFSVTFFLICVLSFNGMRRNRIVLRANGAYG